MGVMFRQISIYVGLILLGLIAGYIFFSNDSNISTEQVQGGNEQILTGRWTCSMHPQVNGEKDGKCPLCAMNLVFMENKVQSLSDSQFRMDEDAMKLADVQIMKVGVSESRDFELNLSGLITTNKETDAVQTTLFDGRIDRLFTNSVGKKVYRGQQIGQIYSPELYLAQDKLLTSSSYKDTHPKLYNAARNTLGLWKMTDAQIDSLLKSEKPFINFPLYADVSGTITELIASEGNYYKQGDPLYKVSDLRSVWAVLDAYESQLSFLKVGQKVKLIVQGIYENHIEGTVSFIDPILDKKKRTASVRVVLNNKNGNLKPGMFVNATVKISDLQNEAENRIIVPRSSVLWTGKRSLIYKKVHPNQPVFEIQQVVLGKSLGDKYEIVEGLNPGDEIVVNGTFLVDASAQLQGKKSMMGFNNDDNSEIEPLNDGNVFPEADFPAILSNEIEEGFEKLIEDYIQLKDDLISSDFAKVNKSSKNMLITINKMASKFEVAQSDHLKNLKFHTGELEGATNIEKQRKEFKFVSELMIGMAQKVNGLPSKLYVQHCDCADGFKGGSWLSADDKILNPYFGDEMLTCGRVDQVLN